MELRVLHYFLAVAREQSISAAAQSLHLTQPTLSTQLKALEEELGKQLLVRGTKGSRKVILTEEGMILRKRAEEILTLVNKAEEEIAHSDDTVVGTVSIGAGETDIVRYFAKAARTLQKRYPDIRYQISSGNAEYVLEYLDKGLIDFGLVFGEVDQRKYQSLPLPAKDTWGVLMRRDSPLAEKEAITPQDLWDKPLLLSHQRGGSGALFPLAKAGRLPAERGGHLQPGVQRLPAGGRGPGLCPHLGQAHPHRGHGHVLPAPLPWDGGHRRHCVEEVPGVHQGGGHLPAVLKRAAAPRKLILHTARIYP